MIDTTAPKNTRGFTLLELLVVISILAILSTIGVVIFRGVSSNARDSKRKGDIQALSKAYETKYINSSSYQILTENDFSSGNIPSPPEGGDYFNIIASDGSGFKVCTALESHPTRTCNSSSSTCYCATSIQGTIFPESEITGSGSELGLGDSALTHPSSCDPNGTLDDGLVGYWKMDEGSGNSIIDSSGNGNSGFWSGAGSHWVTSIPTNPSFRNAGNFNGVDDQITIPNSTIFNMGLGSMTFSAWASITYDTDNYGDILGKGSWNGTPAYGIMTLGNNCITGYLSNNSYFDRKLTPSYCPTSGSWHHYVVIFDRSSNITLYVDGNPTGSTNITSYNGINFVNSTNILIGSYGWYLKGVIDDARIYNRILSSNEITALFNGCIP